MKRALDIHGRPHGAIDYIQEGVAAGWRVVFWADGGIERMSATELQKRYQCDPFANLNPLTY